MLAVIPLPGKGKVFAVVAHVHVKDAYAEGERIDGFRVLQVPVQPHDGLGARIGKQAVETIVDVVVDNVVDALEFLPFHHLLLMKVVHFQAAHLGVVGGVNQAPALTVQGHIGRVVELDAVDVAKPSLLTGLHVNLREVGKVSRCVHSGIGLTRFGVIHQGGHRPQGVFGNRADFRDRILPDGCQVGFLVRFFVQLPFVPGLTERLAVHLLELIPKERAAVGRTVVEADYFVVPVFLGEVVHETGTVQIGVGAHLEVHGGTFRLQTHH